MTTKNKLPHQSWLQQWWDDLLRGSVSDPLFDIAKNEKQLVVIEDFQDLKCTLALDPPIKKLLNQQKEFQQQAGVQVLCLVKEVLHWRDEQNRVLQSPIYLYPLQFTTDKIKQSVDFEMIGDRFLNPFLEHVFQQKFEVKLEDWLEKNVFPETWTVQHKNIVGNFHYHRFVLLKDYDTYFQDPNFDQSLLRHFFLGEKSSIKSPTSSNLDVIFPMDSDQQGVFDAIMNGTNLTIEGPPGSGKSQVLTNILYQAAKNQQQVVLCSEKRTALQVVSDKLKSVGLGDFCEDIANQQEAKRDFVTALKSTWEYLEKNNEIIDLELFKLYYINLRLNIDSKLHRLSNFPKLPENFKRPSDVVTNLPDASDFVKYREKLKKLNEAYRLTHHHDLNTSAFIFLKNHVFDTEQRFKSFLSAAQQAVSLLENLQNQMVQTFQNQWSELEKLALLSVQARILSNSYFQHCPLLFVPDSKENKRFDKLRDQYQVLKNTIDLHEQQEGFKWRNPWSHEELLEAKSIFTHKSTWSRSFRSWRKEFNRSYQPEVFSRDLALSAINSCLQVHQVYEKWERCLKDLASMGIREPISDIPAVLQLQNTVKREGQNLEEAQADYSLDFLRQIASIDSEIHDLVRFFRHNLHGLYDIRDLKLWLQQILKEESFCFAQLTSVSELLKDATDIYRYLPQVKIFDDLEAYILSSEIEKFKNREPSLFHHKAADFETELEQLLKAEDAYLESQAKDFVQKRAIAFAEYHLLLSTPAAALSNAQKVLKTRLRKGRSILVKEFNKTRQFMSMRDLLSSDAAPWIKLLKPILLLNPVVIAQVFPNEQGSIDLLLFDEASQIPFAHAVPALYRAKQIAVFGDSKQLSPSAYFTQGSAQRSDLLSEARYHFPSLALHFHYRSQHPDLIAFSNRYFYNNQLKMMPVLAQATNGVFCHYIQDGCYHEGENKNESNHLIKIVCSSQLKSILEDRTLNIGVVAFSEKQLDTLVQTALKSDAKFINGLLDNGQLHFTTVEKVQGDEFDFLFISMGYAKNEAGEFHLHMGPLNQEGGERRLNVLFTRARKALHFFHSVKSSDFGHSENLGIAALKNFLIMHESASGLEANSKNQYFNYLQFDVQTKSFECRDPQYLDNALTSLLILTRLSRVNGFGLKYYFTKDKLVHS